MDLCRIWKRIFLICKKRPIVVIFPGGGYGMVSEREAERIAMAYNAAGFHAAVVYYCVEPHTHPLPIQNAANAVAMLRENAEKWNIDTDKVIVCGFSAGGHLAASLSALWNDSEIFSEREIELVNACQMPANLLSAITSGEFAQQRFI